MLAVVLFNNSEEVKVSVPRGARAHARASLKNRELGLIVSSHSTRKRVECGQTRVHTCNRGLRAQVRGLKVIGSSEQVHVVDALAITGDEGRGSLR